MKAEKKHLQDWLRTIAFTHLLTVEPTPSKPLSNDEVLQTFRTIEFSLNKHFLKSSFPKWNPYDRFFMIAFAEGDGISHEKHFHLLVYSPVNADIRQKQFHKGSVEFFLYKEWMKYSSTRLDIRALNQNEAPAVYASKMVRPGYDYRENTRLEEIYWYNFTTPSNTKIKTYA